MLTYRFSLKSSTILRRLLKMTSHSTNFDAVYDKANKIQRTITEVRKELDVIHKTYNEVYFRQLQEEQDQLRKMIEKAQTKLINAEKMNGVPQIPIPNRKFVSANNIVNEAQKPVQLEKVISGDESQIDQNDEGDKPKKEKKEKKSKDPKSKGPVVAELPVDVGRLDLRIAKIEDVQKHPDADTLYVLKINCGEDKPRTVCSGLVKQIPKEDLENRFVMLLCNLKPQKMRGITSEAMVMCASSSDAVEVLIPPKNCEVGDLVYCNGYERNPDDILNPKKKIFEAVAPDLHTNEKLEACYKGVVFNVPGKGNIVSKSLKNVSVK